MAETLSTFHVNTEKGWRGGEQQMSYLMEGLRSRGHGVEVAVQPEGEARRRLEARGFSVHPIEMRGEADPVAILALARRMGSVRPDVVHLHTSHAHTLGTVAARLAGRPIVVVSRRVDFSIFRNSFLGLNGIKYRMGLDRIVCVSDAVRDVLVRDGLSPERLRVVRSAVDPARIRDAAPVDVRRRLDLPPAARIVLAVGALVDHKGHKFLVEAWPKVVAAVPDAYLVIAGEGPLRASLGELAKALWVDRRIAFAGLVDDLPGWFASADLLCMPSVAEGLGTSVLDGMVAGLAIVATRAGGIPEMVRHDVEGLLVEPGDSAGLGDALVRVLSDGDLRARLGAAARRRVDEAFHVDRMVDETVAVYAEALRERRTPDRMPSPI